MENKKLNNLLNLPTDQKLELTYAILDNVRGELKDSEIPEWHKEILDERLKKIENGEMEFCIMGNSERDAKGKNETIKYEFTKNAFADFVKSIDLV